MRLPRTLFFIIFIIILGLTGCTSSAPSNGASQNPNNPNSPAGQQHKNNSDNQPSPSVGQSNEQSASQNNDMDKKNDEEIKEKEVMLVFSDANLMEQYKEPRVIKYKKETNLPTIALKAWQNGPQNKNLVTLMPKNVKIQSLKKEGDTAVVSLSQEIKQANLGSSGEQFLLEEMATILSQFGYKNMKVLIDGKEVETILGHMDTTTPIEPLNLDQLKEMK